jgi:hypothetical protein
MPTLAIVDASTTRGPAELTWYRPGSDVRGPVPNVRGVSYHQLVGDQPRPGVGHDGVDVAVRRPVVRALRRLRAVEAFLRSPSMSVGDGVFSEVTGPPAANVSVFAAARFARRVYHLFVKGADDLRGSIGEFASINLVTGCCLFSDRTLRVFGVDDTEFDCLFDTGKLVRGPVARIEQSPSLTLYELECACRLPGLTADLIGAIPAQTPITVTLDMPRVQYYLYLLDAFNRGFLTRALMLRWLALVDRRSRLITDLFRRRLVEAIECTAPGRRVSIQLAASLTCLESAIHTSIATGTPLAVSEMTGILATHDRIWSTLLAVRTPQRYRDVINLSYVVEQLRAGIVRADGSRRLTIAVDDVSERRVCAAARRAGAELQTTGSYRGTLVGLYPLPRIFTTTATGGSDLYRSDPGHVFEDFAERRFSSAELLSRVYADMRRAGRTAQLPVRRLRTTPVRPLAETCIRTGEPDT